MLIAIECPRDRKSRLKISSDFVARTPLTILVPILVTNPFTLSDRTEETTRVDPGSFGASKLAHSCKPSRNEARDS